MSDLTRYRIVENDGKYHYDLTVDREDGYWRQNADYSGTHRLVPDSTLQDIADTWSFGSIGDGEHLGRIDVRHVWPELAALLDGLVNDE